MIGDEDQQVITASAGTVDTAAPAPPRPAHQRRATARSIDQAGRDRIGRGLRLRYAEILALPIPDRFLTMLDDLAACSDAEAQR